MSQYDNNMRGVLFKNDRKQKETHPDYKGSCEIDGVEMWMSAWIKEGKSGKFMSFSFERKEQNKPVPQPNRSPDNPAGTDDFEDDIPFM